MVDPVCFAFVGVEDQPVRDEQTRQRSIVRIFPFTNKHTKMPLQQTGRHRDLVAGLLLCFFSLAAAQDFPPCYICGSQDAILTTPGTLLPIPPETIPEGTIPEELQGQPLTCANVDSFGRNGFGSPELCALVEQCKFCFGNVAWYMRILVSHLSTQLRRLLTTSAAV